MTSPTNVATLLTAQATRRPDQIAVVAARRNRPVADPRYDTITFRQLNELSDRIARGLKARGIRPGTRLVLLVKPSVEFVALVFGLFKAGVVTVLIDPGMGRRHLVDCLAATETEGFIALPVAHLLRRWYRRRFPKSWFHVTVGPRWFSGGIGFDELTAGEWTGPESFESKLEDPAAIIFTTGSTGPPKGVLYRHGNFVHQVLELQKRYAIAPGEVDLACFPLFGLFNAAMGVTTVIPDMNPTRPAHVDPAKIVAAVQDWEITQSFGSPAVWHRVGEHCRNRELAMPTLRRVFSAGAPIPPAVLESMRDAIASDGEIHTPYGATESLPVASISASEVLSETRARWAAGSGTCVGSRFPGIQWRIVKIVDGPLVVEENLVDLPVGEIGELLVSGPVVTTEYVTRVECNALAKVNDGDKCWHRMGDVGYFDIRGRFWFCGRMAHRVETAAGTFFTDPCEGIFNQHPEIARSALVGVGDRPNQIPVMIFERTAAAKGQSIAEQSRLLNELIQLGQSHTTTRGIERFLFHPAFPVDIRHNAKIFREQLADWAKSQFPVSRGANS